MKPSHHKTPDFPPPLTPQDADELFDSIEDLPFADQFDTIRSVVFSNPENIRNIRMVKWCVANAHRLPSLSNLQE